MEDNWENLAGLSLSERPNSSSTPPAAAVEASTHANDVKKPPTPPPAESSPAQPQHQVQQQMPPPQPVAEYEAVDAAIRQALGDPAQRLTVLKCEDLVEKYLADPCQETLQFPASFTSYQRMLAHRVGQYYGLQTSTVDYEDSQGRVVAIRLKTCYEPKPRLRNLDVRSDVMAQRTSSTNGFGSPVADKPRLLRRQDEDRSQLTSSEQSTNQSPVRSIKERHENYMKAREELGLGSGPQDGMGRGGRGMGPGGRFGNAGRMDGGRGRKAVFRDKDKDLSDPDYRRGMNRFSGAARFDPAYTAMPAGGIYQVPTYSSEFPALNRMAGGTGAAPGRPHMPQHQAQQTHQLAPGAQPGPMSGHAAQQTQAGPGAWGQQHQQQGPGGVRPPPPPPPPHQHAGGPSGAAVGGAGGGGSSGKPHHQASGGGGAGGIGGRQQQQPHAQQQQQAYGQAMAYPGVAAQYPMQMAVGTAGFMSGPHGQAVFGMTPTGGAIPGAMYAAPASGVGGAFYPGVGMGMGTMSMAVPATGAYGYVATAAPGVGVGMSSSGEAITLAPHTAYPMFTGYPAGATVYQATQAGQVSQAAAMHHPMRPVYGITPIYSQYDPSQYGQGQGEGRTYSGGYGGGYHGQQHYGGQHHGSGNHSHGHGAGRIRDSENGVGRGEQHATAGGAGSAAEK